MTRWLALLALGCSTLHAASSPHEGAATRDPAFEAYRQALVAEFAQSRDARRLLAAAAFSSIDAESAKHARELFARAAAAGTGDPIVQWAAALQSCESGKPCPDDATAARLARGDADNAIVPIALLDRAGDTTRATLARAASAARYDDYVWRIAQALYAVTADAPVTGKAGAPADRLVNSIGVSVAISMPHLGGLMRQCVPAASDDVRGDCLKVARKMTAGTASVLSYRVGARLIASLAADAAEREAWEVKLDESRSMVDRAGRATSFLLSDAAGVEALTSAFTKSHDEMAFQRAVIIAAAARGN